MKKVTYTDEFSDHTTAYEVAYCFPTTLLYLPPAREGQCPCLVITQQERDFHSDPSREQWINLVNTDQIRDLRDLLNKELSKRT